MANNKVIFGNTTIMDITDTTATADDVAKGKSIYLADGTKVTGTASIFSDLVWKDPITLTYSNSNADGTLEYVEAENYPFFKLVGRTRRKTAGTSTGNSYTYFYTTNDDLPEIDAVYGVRNRYELAYTNDLTVTTDTILNTQNTGYEGQLRLRLNNVNSNYWQYYGGEYIWWIDKNRCEDGDFFSGLNFIRNNLSI